MLKKWWFWTIVSLTILSIILIITIIFTNIAASNKLKAEERNLSTLKEDNNKIQKEVFEMNNKISELQRDEEKKKINEEIDKLKEEQKSLEEDIKDKKSEKTSLEKELKKLKGEILTSKGKAKTYPAGQLVAGEDFNTGRYKIYGGNSNFVVYSRYGELEVNIILGDWGVDEYVYTFKEGDEIEAQSSFKLQPIE